MEIEENTFFHDKKKSISLINILAVVGGLMIALILYLLILSISLQTKTALLEEHTRDTTNIVKNELSNGLDRMKQDTINIVREQLSVAIVAQKELQVGLNRIIQDMQTQDKTKIVQELNTELKQIQNTVNSAQEELKVALTSTQDTANTIQTEVYTASNQSKEMADAVKIALDKTRIAQLENHEPTQKPADISREELGTEKDAEKLDMPSGRLRNKREVNDTQKSALTVQELDIKANHTQNISKQTSIAQLQRHMWDNNLEELPLPSKLNNTEDTAKVIRDELSLAMTHILNYFTQDTVRIVREELNVASSKHAKDTANIVQKELNAELNHIQEIALQTKTAILEGHIQGTTNIIQMEINNGLNHMKQDMDNIVRERLKVALNHTSDTASIVQKELGKELNRIIQDMPNIVRKELNVALNQALDKTTIVQELNAGFSRIQNTVNSAQQELKAALRNTQDTANNVQREVNTVSNQGRETANAVQNVLNKVQCSGGRVSWVSASNGQVPSNAIEGGHLPDGGEKLYICHVNHEKYLRPGVVHPSHGQCYISFNGKEIWYSSYQVLVFERN